MSESTQQNDANGGTPLAEPTGSPLIESAAEWAKIGRACLQRAMDATAEGNFRTAAEYRKQSDEAFAKELRLSEMANHKGESPAPEGRVVLDPLDVPRFAARQDGGSPLWMSATRSVGDIASLHSPEWSAAERRSK